MKIELSADDVAKTRIGYSAVWETTASLHALTSPASYALHRSFRRRLSKAGRAAAAELIDLTRVNSWIPQSLSPQPLPGPGEPLAEFAALRGIELDRIDRDLEVLRRTLPHSRWAKMDSVQFPDELAARFATYWSLELKEHWEAIVSINRSDADARGREFATDGVGATLGRLHPSVSYAASELEINVAASASGLIRQGQGQGMWLVPSVFRWPKLALSSSSTGAVVLSYPAKGAGTLWEGNSAAGQGLVALMGRSRAAVLEELAIPRTTTWLAGRLDLAPATVSAHLSALALAGLVKKRREGRSVLYAQTSLGRHLAQGVPPLDRVGQTSLDKEGPYFNSLEQPSAVP